MISIYYAVINLIIKLSRIVNTIFSSYILWYAFEKPWSALGPHQQSQAFFA